MVSRRQFLKAGAFAGAGLVMPRVFAPGVRLLRPQVSAARLEAGGIPKYVAPLIIPPAMPRTTKVKQQAAKNIDYYEIAVRQFRQQILPPGMPLTTVWSYGSANHPGSFNFPAFTIEAKVNKPVRVKWINQLVDSGGRYLPHLLPVDPTLHWANPPGGLAGRDTRPSFGATPGAYTGPVPIVTHVHGAHTTAESDGYAEAWYLPGAANTPAGFARVGSKYDQFQQQFEAVWGQPWSPGTSVFQYPNTQRATALWYHDHTLGMTRLNVYAGPAGFYLLRGGGSDLPTGVLPGPAPALGDPPGTRYYEIPIAIQDRSFSADGALRYPASREEFDGYAGPYIPASDISPIWNPEFFGDTMVVNGRTWPYLEVEPRRYRFRLLNGCNSRFLILALDNPDLNFWQIGAEGGFLPAPVQLGRLLMAPAERADVIVDFSRLAGRTISLLNLGPDEPFGGGEPGVDFDVANPATTGQVMQFRVTLPLNGRDSSVDPALGGLALPAVPGLGAPTRTRQLSLNEMMDMDADIPIAAMLGTVDNGAGTHQMWADPISENVGLGDTEVWELYNFTADAHPIHVHQVQFQVLDRQIMAGATRLPEPWELGYKDTVIAYPGEITRIKARFDLPGLYVWHCHIVEHEDNEMMRPFLVS